MAQCSAESSLRERERETGADARFSSEGRRGDDKGWMAMSNVDKRRGGDETPRNKERTNVAREICGIYMYVCVERERENSRKVKEEGRRGGMDT